MFHVAFCHERIKLPFVNHHIIAIVVLYTIYNLYTGDTFPVWCIILYMFVMVYACVWMLQFMLVNVIVVLYVHGCFSPSAWHLTQFRSLGLICMLQQCLCASLSALLYLTYSVGWSSCHLITSGLYMAQHPFFADLEHFFLVM